MEAKDTIQDKIRCAKLQLGDDYGDEQMMEEAVFKAGKQEGIQLVVEQVCNVVYEAGITQKLLDNTKDKRVGLNYQSQALKSALDKYQAFLKEKGMQ